MTKSNGKDSKVRILEVATMLFSTKGYDATTTRQICDKANASLSSITTNFKNKEGILKEILNSMDDNVFKVPVRILEGGAKSEQEFATKLTLFLEKLSIIC